MNPLLLTLIPKVLDKFFPDPVQKQEFEQQLKQMDAAERAEAVNFLLELNKGQTQVNLEEAKSESLFKSGCRPFLFWGLSFAALWSFLGYPVLTVLWPFIVDPTVVPGSGVIMPSIPELSTNEVMWELLFGLAGLTGVRSYEKKLGIHNI